MGQRWERFWLGKPGSRARDVQPRTRAVWIGIWTVLLVGDVIGLLLVAHHYITGALLGSVAVANIVGQVIPLMLQRRADPPAATP